VPRQIWSREVSPRIGVDGAHQGTAVHIVSRVSGQDRRDLKTKVIRPLLKGFANFQFGSFSEQ